MFLCCGTYTCFKLPSLWYGGAHMHPECLALFLCAELELASVTIRRVHAWTTPLSPHAPGMLGAVPLC